MKNLILIMTMLAGSSVFAEPIYNKCGFVDKISDKHFILYYGTIVMRDIESGDPASIIDWDAVKNGLPSVDENHRPATQADMELHNLILSQPMANNYEDRGILPSEKISLDSQNRDLVHVAFIDEAILCIDSNEQFIVIKD